MEGDEGTGEDGMDEYPSRGGRNLTKILAVLVGLALVGAGVGVYTILFTGSPRNLEGSFTYEAIDLRLTVNAEALRGAANQYRWDWGDTSPPDFGLRAAHDYTSEGSYTVTLTVTGGGQGSTSQTVEIKVLPRAFFAARHNRMNVSFDASGSLVSTGDATIVAYDWEFGDGATGEGLRTNHTYDQQQRYEVTLEVTDSLGRKGIATRLVSPADTTVDILVDQFFEAGCPFSPYWPTRREVYGEIPLSETKPCIHFYPWVFYSSSPALQRINPSWVYTLYRYDARVRNHRGYDLDDPVILPVLNPSAVPDPTSFLRFNLTFEYMDDAFINAMQTTSLPVNPSLNDGYGYLVRGTFTMDLQTSRRFFWVNASTPEDARTWWATNTTPDDSSFGKAETNLDRWIILMGGENGKYDVANGFEWWVQTDITDLKATVADDGTTTVQVFMTGWGYEALLARWWYWGNASYKEAVNSDYGVVQPRGWAPMEVCWCEQSTLRGTIGEALDLDYTTVFTYNFQAWSNWGRDGIPDSRDDLPAWVFAPYHLDYVPRAGSGSPAASAYPNSELRWYEGRTVRIGTPGSYGYGESYEVINTPARWLLNPGSSLTIVLPRFDVKWYDPVNSKWDPDARIGNYQDFSSPMTLRQICTDPDDTSTCTTSPAGSYYRWDNRGKVVSIAGPHDWGNELPIQPSPWIEFAPEVMP